MIRPILFYGVIAGLIVTLPMLLLIGGAGSSDHGVSSMLVGYLTMIVALSVIFVAVKQYRDKHLGGVIKFLPALLMGLGISVIASVLYVAAWEVYLNLTHYAFMENYTHAMIESAKAKGVAGPELDQLVSEMSTMKENYKNPLFRLPMTFVEPFPVGVIVSLIAAALMRNSRFMPARAG